jgi:hypothetical protein
LIRYFSSVLVCLFLLGTIPDRATATTITFDGLALGDKTSGPAGKQTTVKEVTFNAAGALYIASPEAFGTSWLTSDYLTLFNASGDLQIVFAKPITSFPADIDFLRRWGPSENINTPFLFAAGTWKGGNTIVETFSLPNLSLSQGAAWAPISFSLSTSFQMIAIFDPS